MWRGNSDVGHLGAKGPAEQGRRRSPSLGFPDADGRPWSVVLSTRYLAIVDSKVSKLVLMIVTLSTTSIDANSSIHQMTRKREANLCLSQ